MSKLWRVGAVSLVIFTMLPISHPVRGAEDAPSAAKATDSGCRRSAFRVVLDVGHTLEVPGAISARGVPEYIFNLTLAEIIQQALLAAGFDKTVRLITATAPWRGLVERAARANSMHADLFIAIHHDSVPDELLETWQYEGQENHFSDRFSGYATFVSNDNPGRAGSLAFGRFLGKELQSRGLHYTPHYTLPLMGRHRHELLDAAAGVYRYDQLVVLRETRMPAVLLEAGSIVNRQEELELATPDRRLLIAQAAAAAVEDFCAARARAQGNNKQPPSAKPATPGRLHPASLAH
jgi:N-acetylmuramoyl-L-alanine amidase